jgi:hypothetical protein
MPQTTANLTPTAARFAWMANDGQLSDSQRGRAVLEVRFGDDVAVIGTEQKFLAYGFPMVFLGNEWEDAVPAITLEKDEIHRGIPAFQETLRGYTQDSRIVRLTRQMLDEVNRGVFLPRTLQV